MTPIKRGKEARHVSGRLPPLNRSLGGLLVPIGHLGINVPDLALAKQYYDAIMPVLNYEPFLAHHDQFAYRPAGAKAGTYLFVYPSLQPGSYSADATGLQHLMFIVKTRTAVREVAEIVRGLGSDIIHEPQEWPQYPPPYYACFWRDPFGFTLEAGCHHDRD